MAGLGGIVCFLLTHEILSTRQNMLERSEHTAYPPRLSSLPRVPPSRSHNTWKSIRVLKISVVQN